MRPSSPAAQQRRPTDCTDCPWELVLLINEFRKRNVHQQIGGDLFQFGFQRGVVTTVGQLQPGDGLEKRFAGHGRADTFAGKLLDVHVRARQGTGDFADDARAVVPDDFEFGLPALRIDAWCSSSL